MPAGRERAGEEARALWRVHRLLGLSEVQVHPADYHGDQLHEVRSTVRGRKEDKNRDGQRVHKRRMRLGETGAGREAGGAAGRRGTGNGEGLGRSIWQADETGASRREVLRKRTLSPPTTESRYRTGSRSDLRRAARKCVYNPLKRRK